MYVARDPYGQEARGTVTLTVPGACEEICLRGDYYAAIRTRSGALRSAHCWLDADGQPGCDTDADGVLILGEPMCGE